MNLLSRFEKQNKSLQSIVGFLLIGLIGFIDFITGYELAFSLFYIFPIALATWFINRKLGIVVSFVSAIAWLTADIATGHTYSYPLIPIWNCLIRLSFFLIITLLLTSVKNLTEREKELSRTDSLTGAVNSRLFIELLQMEIYRLQRYKHPFSLAYVDLDHFKKMNDQHGHAIGDAILQTVVVTARNSLRNTDVVARLGGDEFAFLLPETNPETAELVLSKVQDALLTAMQQHNWAITFSIGVLTCTNAPNTSEDLVKMADQLMYAVKRDGKNAMKFATYTNE